MTPANITIDLCTILGGALCPLPHYNFSGSDSLSLPQSLGVSNRLPGIAFKIPDLEGFAQLKLIQVGTGNVKACVQATLSNGWSTYQPAVGWTTAGVAVLALTLAAWKSSYADSIFSYRLLDLMYLYQTIASSAFLGLNYPSVYRSFTLNFAWSMGLLPLTALQNSINNMRHLTGGNMADASSGSAVGLVNRRLSPYNSLAQSSFVVPTTLLDSKTFIHLPNLAVLPESVSLPDDLHTLSSQSEVQTVTAASGNVLQAGIPIYVNSIHIASANAFMTVFICALMLIGLALVISVIGYIFFKLRSRSGNWNHPLKFRSNYRSIFRAWFFCLVCFVYNTFEKVSHAAEQSMVIFFPLIIFAFYQWTLKDSWLSISLSVIFLLAIFASIGYPAFSTFRLARSLTPHALYFPSQQLAFHGPLYSRFRAQRYYYFLPNHGTLVIKALVIAFGQRSGLAQIVLFLIVDLFNVVAFVVLHPHRSKGDHVFSIYLAIIRLLCTGLMIAFIQRLQVSAIVRVAIGIVIAVILSITVIVVVISLLLNLGLSLREDSRSSSETSEKSDETALEKGDGSSTQYSHKPVNATPSTKGQESTPHMRDSATSLGSVMPSRWSFPPLQTSPQSTVYNSDSPPSFQK